MRIPLTERNLPNYTKGEEIFHMTSHIAGGVFALVALLLCVIKSALGGNAWAISTSIVYGLTMIVLYCLSSVYHGLKPSLGKKVLQVLDHCSIYFMIAGTYTPILLVALRPAYPVLAWSSTMRACPTSHTPPKSLRPCCVGSRPKLSSLPAARL